MKFCCCYYKLNLRLSQISLRAITTRIFPGWSCIRGIMQHVRHTVATMMDCLPPNCLGTFSLLPPHFPSHQMRENSLFHLPPSHSSVSDISARSLPHSYLSIILSLSLVYIYNYISLIFPFPSLILYIIVDRYLIPTFLILLCFSTSSTSLGSTPAIQGTSCCSRISLFSSLSLSLSRRYFH